MNNQKGIINTTLIVVIVVITIGLIAGAFWFFNNDNEINDVQACIEEHASSGLTHIDYCYKDCCENYSFVKRDGCFDVCYSMD